MPCSDEQSVRYCTKNKTIFFKEQQMEPTTGNCSRHSIILFQLSQKRATEGTGTANGIIDLALNFVVVAFCYFPYLFLLFCTSPRMGNLTPLCPLSPSQKFCQVNSKQSIIQHTLRLHGHQTIRIKEGRVLGFPPPYPPSPPLNINDANKVNLTEVRNHHIMVSGMIGGY